MIWTEKRKQNKRQAGSSDAGPLFFLLAAKMIGGGNPGGPPATPRTVQAPKYPRNKNSAPAPGALPGQKRYRARWGAHLFLRLGTFYPPFYTKANYSPLPDGFPQFCKQRENHQRTGKKQAEITQKRPKFFYFSGK